MAIRRITLSAAHRVGVINLWRRANRRKIPILMLHGVEAPQADGHPRPLRPRLPLADFERYIQVLSRYFSFISLDDAVGMLSGSRDLQGHCLVLTFDDAYLNNAAHAFGILKKYGATGTFFLPTGYIQTGKFFWADRLDYAIRCAPEELESLVVCGKLYRIDAKDRRTLVRAFWSIKDLCANLGWKRAEEVVDSVEEQTGARVADSNGEDNWAGIMSWDDVLSLREQGASFASHTVEHYPLSELSEDEVMRELKASRDEIEQRISAPCRTLGYPRGQCTERVVTIAREVGYTSAVTTVEKGADVADSPMRLPRIGVPRLPVASEDLLARATGLSRALSNFRKAFTPLRRGSVPDAQS